MEKRDKIFVAGHRGLVGSAIVRRLRHDGFSNIVTRSRGELDLTNQAAVRKFFDEERPAYVFNAAARVGGIIANNSFPAEFIQQNLAIELNVVHECWRHDVKRLLFLGSSCIYPRECPQPMREEYLLTGPLESTNRPYAIAKIAGIEMCWAYNRQYGTKYLSVMPTNLYGPGDSYDLRSCHVLPALVRKTHEAIVRQDREVIVFGTGRPYREFLYVDDMAEACVFLAMLDPAEFEKLVGSEETAPLINIGYGEDLTIRDLAETIARVLGFHGELRYDTSKPDGTPRKLLDSTRMLALGWKPRVRLDEGLLRARDDFVARYPASHDKVNEA